MAVDVFKARLVAQTDLIRKSDFDSKLLKIRLNTCWLKINQKNYKNLMLLVLEAKVILKKMVHKII